MWNNTSTGPEEGLKIGGGGGGGGEGGGAASVAGSAGRGAGGGRPWLCWGGGGGGGGQAIGHLNPTRPPKEVQGCLTFDISKRRKVPVTKLSIAL